MAHAFELIDRIGTRATLGLIVLQTDETLEQEFRRFFTASDVAIYVSRVPSGADVTPETLAAMALEIPKAAALLPHALAYDAVSYGCTSGSMVIGPNRVSELIKGATTTSGVTNPMTAVMTALSAVNANKIGVLTPYIESVTTPMCDALNAQGFTVSDCISFEEMSDSKVARIAPKSVAEAAITLGKGDVDAVFLSCTNLRTIDVIDQIEAAINKPVISSNQALAWHMAQLAGTTVDHPVGQLMRT